jgi:hypothetical protein
MGVPINGRRLGAIVVAAALAVACLGEARAATVAAIQTGVPAAGGVLLSGADGCGTGAVTTSVGSFTAGGKKKARIACGAGSSLATNKRTRTLTWDIGGVGEPVTAAYFTISNRKALKKGSFSIEAGGASWTLVERLRKGSSTLFAVIFDEPVKAAQIVFNSKRAFALNEVRVAPIPLPAAGLLLGAGLVTLAAGLGRRRRLAA